jgi:hypothetical protein
MIDPLPPVEKYCFVYCGPERCDCWRGRLLTDPFGALAPIEAFGRDPQGLDGEATKAGNSSKTQSGNDNG